jgi:hypothetical protein
VTILQAGEMPSPVVLKVEFEDAGPAVKPSANTEVIDSKTAIVTYPVDVWFGGAKDFDAVLDFGNRKIKKITFDPARRFPDRDPKDNEWSRP